MKGVEEKERAKATRRERSVRKQSVKGRSEKGGWVRQWEVEVRKER